MLTTKRRQECADDSGVTLIIVALSLVVLMVFAAFAIDLGAVYSERRINQNSADAGATSAGIQLLRGQSTQAAVSEAVAKVNSDLERILPVAEWTDCDDPSPLARTAKSMGLTPPTECISFSVGFDALRVRVPDQAVGANFGRVVGINSFTSSAFAQVGIGTAGGGALPFVVTALATNGDQVCLRTSSASDEPPDQPGISPYTVFQPDPCNEESFITHSGARGTIKPYRYVGCVAGPGNQSIFDAVIAGMDHPLGVFNPAVSYVAGQSANATDVSTAARLDGDLGCTTPLPNTVDIDTGFVAGLLECALISPNCTAGAVTSGRPGRLSTSSNESTFAGERVNDTPLWEYFLDTLPNSAPSSCTAAASNATPFNTRRAALLNCLDQWTTGELFKESIASERRLGFVPKVAERCLYDMQAALPQDCGGAGLDNVHINDFAPVYIDGLYQDKGAKSAPLCDADNLATVGSEWAIHYPGRDMKCGGSNSNVDRMSALIVPCGSLPASVCDPSSNPPFPDPAGLYRVRLTK